MNWRRVWVSLLCICFTLLLFDNVLAQDRPRQRTSRWSWKGPDIGSVIADFELKTLDGKTLKLSDHKGEIVVLEFGAVT